MKWSEAKRNETKWTYNSPIPAEYANSKICSLRNQLFEDCNDMQPISSDSLIQLDAVMSFEAKQGIKQRINLVQDMQIQKAAFCENTVLICNSSLLIP